MEEWIYYDCTHNTTTHYPRDSLAFWHYWALFVQPLEGYCLLSESDSCFQSLLFFLSFRILTPVHRYNFLWLGIIYPDHLGYPDTWKHRIRLLGCSLFLFNPLINSWTMNLPVKGPDIGDWIINRNNAAIFINLTIFQNCPIGNLHRWRSPFAQ